MTIPKIVVVIPTIRKEQYESFLNAWEPLFLKHKVTLVTVWDGEELELSIKYFGEAPDTYVKRFKPLREDSPFPSLSLYEHRSLFYRYTDACRNLGFVVAAHLNPDYVLTLDDDVEPMGKSQNFYDDKYPDPIQAHLNVLQKRVPLGWMNTAHDTDLYLRGVPYGIRNEAPVILSHGVWVGTPDFDGETQLNLEQGYEGENSLGHKPNPKGVPYSLPYYVGPISKGVLFACCGMNVMVRKGALPYFYFAPMGKDTGIEGLNRFADIWMGISLKKKFDELGWACYTGGSTVLHTRASDAQKNFEQEKLGREWNELIWDGERIPNCDLQNTNIVNYRTYLKDYHEKRKQFADLITSILSQ